MKNNIQERDVKSPPYHCWNLFECLFSSAFFHGVAWRILTVKHFNWHKLTHHHQKWYGDIYNLQEFIILVIIINFFLNWWWLQKENYHTNTDTDKCKNLNRNLWKYMHVDWYMSIHVVFSVWKDKVRLQKRISVCL